MTDENKIFYVACHNWENRYSKTPRVAKIDVSSKEQWIKEIEHVFSSYKDMWSNEEDKELEERLNKLKTKSPSKNIDIWVLFMCSGDIRESFKEDVLLSTNNNNDEHYSVYDKNLNWLHDVEISEIDYQFDKFLEE